MITKQTSDDLSKPVNALAADISGRPVATVRLALTTTEACTALGISSVSLWRLRKRGLIHPVAVLRTLLYPVKELERFLNSGKEAAQ